MTLPKKRGILCAVLTVLMLLFIWGNSFLTGASSGALSGRVMEWINSFLHLDAQSAQTLHLAIRKMAHFTEFACLGILLAWLFGMKGAKKGYIFYMPLLFGLLAACVDETIQSFVPNRGSSLIDVWIDTMGLTAGILLQRIGQFYIRKNTTDKMEETT